MRGSMCDHPFAYLNFDQEEYGHCGNSVLPAKHISGGDYKETITHLVCSKCGAKLQKNLIWKG